MYYFLLFSAGISLYKRQHDVKQEI